MSDPIEIHKASVARAIAMISAAYPNKFNVGTLGVAVWSDMLHDLSPEEVMGATSAWISKEKWPPSIADLRGMVPRFCRCGRCSACHRRAVERAGRALERGSIGADFDSNFGETLDEARKRFFGAPKGPQLPGGNQPKRLQ